MPFDSLRSLRVRRLMAAVLLASPAYAAEPAREPPKTAVLVVGPDAPTTGALQRALEARLVALPQLRLRTGDQVIGLLGADVPASEALSPKAAEALERAAKAFYDERLDEAATAAGSAEALAGSGPKLAAKIRGLLWRAAIAEARGDKTAAQSLAKAALAFAPDLEVDQRFFPPDLAALVTGLQSATARSASLAVSAPPGALVRVDDRLTEGRVAVTPGKHWVVVTGRGLRPVEMQVTVAGDSAISVTPPLALPASIDTAISAFAIGGGAQGLEDLARRLEVEVVFAVAALPGKPLQIRHFGDVPSPAGASATFPADAVGQAALVDWIEARFKPAPAAKIAERVWRGWAEAGLASGGHQRFVRAGATEFDSFFFGGGPSFAVRVEPGPWRAGAELSAVRYALGEFTATFPDGTEATVGGGTTVAARVEGGRAFGAGPGGRLDQPEIAPLAAISWERHIAEDLDDDRGSLGYLPSHERVAIDIGFRASGPLARTGSRVLRGELRVSTSPVSWWRETPDGATGRTVQPESTISAGVGVAMESRGGWRLGIAASGELRPVQFRGTGSLPSDPPVRDARVRDGVQTMSVTAGRYF